MTARPRQRVLGPWDSRAPARRGTHGLTAAERDFLMAKGCHICHRMDRPLQIDHDHRHCPGPLGCRRCVRGAVCGRCNRALWCLDDNPVVVSAMLAYLRRSA